LRAQHPGRVLEKVGGPAHYLPLGIGDETPLKWLQAGLAGGAILSGGYLGDGKDPERTKRPLILGVRTPRRWAKERASGGGNSLHFAKNREPFGSSGKKKGALSTILAKHSHLHRDTSLKPDWERKRLGGKRAPTSENGGGSVILSLKEKELPKTDKEKRDLNPWKGGRS